MAVKNIIFRKISYVLSKALGCKRVHDDRIAEVTFEENASRNALIVNEEYAWAENPFSAQPISTKRIAITLCAYFFYAINSKAEIPLNKHLATNSFIGILSHKIHKCRPIVDLSPFSASVATQSICFIFPPLTFRLAIKFYPFVPLSCGGKIILYLSF